MQRNLAFSAEPRHLTWSSLAQDAWFVNNAASGKLLDKQGNILLQVPGSISATMRAWGGTYVYGRNGGFNIGYPHALAPRQPTSLTGFTLAFSFVRPQSVFNGNICCWGNTASATNCAITFGSIAATGLISIFLSLREDPVGTLWSWAWNDVGRVTIPAFYCVRFNGGLGEVEMYQNGNLLTPSSAPADCPTFAYTYTVADTRMWMGAAGLFSAYGVHRGSAFWDKDLGPGVARALSADMYGMLYSRPRSPRFMAQRWNVPMTSVLPSSVGSAGRTRAILPAGLGYMG